MLIPTVAERQNCLRTIYAFNAQERKPTGVTTEEFNGIRHRNWKVYVNCEFTDGRLSERERTLCIQEFLTNEHPNRRETFETRDNRK